MIPSVESATYWPGFAMASISRNRIVSGIIGHCGTKVKIKPCNDATVSEKMPIPEGTRHQYINFTSEPIKLYFAVAPGL